MAGAAVGALIGAAIDGKKGAARGAGAGVIGGLLVGDNVAKKKQEYAMREDALRLSAERAQALAAQTHQQNEELATEIVTLQREVQRLRAQKMSASAKQTALENNRIKVAGLLGGIDTQLRQVTDEIVRQQALLEKEQRLAMESHDDSLAPSVQRVAAGVRDLQSNQRTLEQAKAQLQLIDQRRAY